jgi:tRNA threonylcarbamoyladenosine biosynthesis protein TsaB
VLAFDTSTDVMALALESPAGRWTQQSEGGAAASATLVPQLRALLARAGLAVADLDAVAFGRGPGAFTGLRTACAVAQGFALGTGVPLLPVDSLMIVADDARAVHGADDVLVLMDARMGEVYAGRYAWTGGRWQVRSAPALYAPEALSDLWADGAPALAAGSALAVLSAERLALPAGVARMADTHDRAAALLRLALAAAEAGEGVDGAAALPLYLRDKVAQTTREREAARAASRDVARVAAAP